MSVLYIVLPLAILIAIGAVSAFIWMVKGGQLDDLDSPALRMLHDESPRASNHEPMTAEDAPATSGAHSNDERARAQS